MLLFELTCLLIVAAYLVSALKRSETPRKLLARFVVLFLASFVAEDTCIRAYHLYQYSPSWFPFLDRVPLLIALIWPTVILSASELATALGPRRGRAGSPAVDALTVGALVFTDAAFIEPVSVHAGLWSWNAPGLLGVPLIGLLGWALFAASCQAVLRNNDRRGRRALADLAVILAAPLLTHLGLLLLHWTTLRWVNTEVSPWTAAALAWIAGLMLLALSLGKQARRTISRPILTSRIPASLLFLGLLLWRCRSDLPLVVYALAFPPPYLSLIDWRAWVRRAREQEG